MTSIFDFTDEDGDRIEVDTEGGERVMVSASSSLDGGASAYADARELRDALSRHLGDEKAKLQPAAVTERGFVGTFGVIDDEGDSLRVWDHPRQGSIVVEATQGRIGGHRVVVEVPLKALVEDLVKRQEPTGLASWERELLEATEEPFRFDLSGAEDRVSSAVFQALGAASVCWERMSGTGIFDDARAKAIGDARAKAIGDALVALVQDEVAEARVDGIERQRRATAELSRTLIYTAADLDRARSEAYTQGSSDAWDAAGRASQAREDAYADGYAEGKAEAEATAVAAFRLLQKVGEA